MSKRFLDTRLVRFAARAMDPEKMPEHNCTPEDMAAMNAMPGVLKPMTEADMYVRECEAINDQPLKNSLRLGVAELAQIAALSPGYGIHVNHDTYTAKGGLPVGRILSANMGSMPWPVDKPEPYMSASYNAVSQRFAIFANDEGTDLVRKIDAGIVREVSVSFAYDMLMCSICDTDMSSCAHWPGEEYDGKKCEGMVRGVTEYFETSLVWQGMAEGTRIRMAASRQVLCGDADLADFFREKPRADSLAALMTPKPLAALFAAEQPLETLFTK